MNFLSRVLVCPYNLDLTKCDFSERNDRCLKVELVFLRAAAIREIFILVKILLKSFLFVKSLPLDKFDKTKPIEHAKILALLSRLELSK